MEVLALPEPVSLPWTMKPLSSADTRLEVLDDGRLLLSIRHDVLQGVTPEMLAWWFRNIAGDVEIEGRRLPRYRAWHPRDHVLQRTTRRNAAGEIGPGAQFEIHEVLGRDPAFRVDVLTDIERLDEGGFRHRPRGHGVKRLGNVLMDYRFTRVPGGTRYENTLTVGVRGGLPARLQDALRRRFFPNAQGRAWLLHNVEEVGNLEFFLPRLFARETGRDPRAVA